MNLTSALSIATGGIANINTQLALISQNVANAGTAGYATEVSTQSSIVGDGVGFGVRTGVAQRQIDQALTDSLTVQNATVSNLATTQTALQAIDSVLGTVGDGNDLGSLVGALQDSFSTLLTDPGSQAAQSAVVSAAGTLAGDINTLSASLTQQRTTAQQTLQSEVDTLNQTLGTIGQLSDKIMAATAVGHATADLENQRDAAVQTLSSLVGVKTIQQANGDLLVYTSSGTQLPIHGTSAPFSIAGGSTQPASYYPGGGLSGILLNGQDVTAGMTGGEIGANLALRDQTIPTAQAELDEFSVNLTSRFAAQGLTLFTDGSGSVPTLGGPPVQAGYVGYAASIQVNPAVQAQPSLVRDGTDTIAGSATGASAFTPNPATGPSGFSTLISRVLSYALGSDAQAGVPQPGFNTTGLGPGGTLTAQFSGAATLASYASGITSTLSAQSNTVTSQLSTEQSVQTALQNQVASVSGVNVDTEMSKMITLQNAYSANARVITVAQSMFNTILQATE
ncbi:flagellar hook-associated protein FlgK [Rhodopila sp.]|jgi:flagellar hook-associated protein 1 FlgK|uniref:flagellar hook-associated protein FlgK n=1 Tax=Rhodopila sp. TaxID=2480087 RepID=UPI002C9F410B|nr:flagellar hook-associated protein FlgK [Rhodopila sp.]HVZ08742.1 flagellar hook-associated protein FlgK [Rhodopila sp.]